MVYERELIEEWFVEVMNHPESARLNTDESIAVIYKGFKLEIYSDIACIFDVRFRDLYSPVSKKNCNLFKRVGFERGCDTIQYHRDLQRIERSKRRISQIETKKMRLEKQNEPKNRRTINGLESKKGNILQDYYMYVSRSFHLKKKLNV